ncbi:hypothetical protein OCD90_11005 [Bacillus pacificus]|uniref:hypothetical protein n=1 Tax=Bacillus cereus group TaxID=86661 RepID=UPI00027CD693|nr:MULTISPECIES: hypothetical protein [Bacillus cereus group]AFQ13090.1 hypothetical protein BCK_26403 [Bacillus cereus FRI-35]ASI80917.1 hypothetical protein BA202_27035 [Bacillus cereus]MCR6464872.1 hypothetical protein [Bacillus paranthracis]MCR9018503.1 hypothetical protein [Bacillus paranthracis]MCU5256299.1 hypothetical protein [Bacillus pacificus]
MKKTLLAGSSLVLLLSSGFAFSSTTQAAENKEGNSPAVSYNQDVSKENRAIDISSLPQQDLDSLFLNGQAPLNPITPKDSDQIQYVHPTAGTFNWKYVTTTYGNNVFYNASYRFMVNAAIAGLGAGIIAKIGNTFASGVAGYVIGGLSLPKSKNYWWTVQKWKDQDAYNVYIKYNIKVYSDSGRTKLVDSYTEQFAQRYR